MNLYHIKRALLTPYRWYRRRREPHHTGFIKAALELHSYSPALYAFMKATIEKPEILHDAPNIDSDSIVFDVGGYAGNWSAKIFERYQPHLYCFELEPNFARRIAARFASNPKIHCFDYGLSGENATLPLVQKDMGSTLYPDSGVQPGTGKSVQVRVRDIVEVLDELQLRSVDLLKLNIEGGEYDVLERMIAANRLRDVACLMVQFHEWLDGANGRRDKIRKALRRTHRLVWDYRFIWEQWVRI